MELGHPNLTLGYPKNNKLGYPKQPFNQGVLNGYTVTGTDITDIIVLFTDIPNENMYVNTRKNVK